MTIRKFALGTAIVLALGGGMAGAAVAMHSHPAGPAGSTGLDGANSAVSADTALPTPPQGWFAGKTAFLAGQDSQVSQPTDPINLVLYDPAGHASDVFTAALKATGQWFNNTCYDPSVVFSADQGQGVHMPSASYATDVSDSGDVIGFSGCGTINNPRDHLRMWVNNADTIVWVAASNEIPTGTIFGAGPHTIAPDGFNTGRDMLASELGAGISNMGQVDGLSYTDSQSLQPNLYSCSSLQNPANTTHSTCGDVAFIVMTHD